MRARLDRNSLEQVRWMLGAAVALVALWSLFPLNLGVRPLVLGAFVCVGFAVCFPRVIFALPQTVWKLMTPILIVVVGADFILARGDLLPPLVRMIVLLMTLRAVEPRSAREDYQLILLALFMVVISGVLSLELSFLLQLFVFAPLVMLFMFLVNISENREEGRRTHRADWKGFRWDRLIVSVTRALDLRLISFSALLFVGVSICTALLFVALPRFEFGQTLSFLKFGSGGSLTGFSESIRFGDVVDIQEDDTVSLRVDLPANLERPTERIYWRMLVLDEFTDSGFRVSESLQESSRELDTHIAQFAVPKQGRNAGDWVVFFEGGISRYLPVPGLFEVIRFQNRQEFAVHADSYVFRTPETLANKLVYRLEDVWLAAQVPGTKADEPLQKRMGESSPDLATYPFTTLATPLGDEELAAVDEVVHELWNRAEGNAERFVREATLWLQSQHPYGLRSAVPAGQGHHLVRWMFSGTPGHCELFAGSLVVLCRHAGIPARIVIGYAGGDWNGFENYYMVRNRDAHAWVEVFDGKDQWLRFDPTPAAAPGVDGPVLASQNDFREPDTSMGAYLDSLRMLWYRRVINFDRAQQRELTESVGSTGRDLLRAMVAELKALGSSFRELLRGHVVRPDRFPLTLLVITVLLGALLLLLRIRARKKNMQMRLLDPRSRERLRRTAGKLLVRMRSQDASLSPEISLERRRKLLASLETIRFGPREAWPEPRSVFKDARAALRRSRKKHGQTVSS